MGKTLNKLILTLLILPLFLFQQACLLCNSGNGGGYSGMQCSQAQTESHQTGATLPMEFVYYHFSESDSCIPASGPVNSGALTDDGSEYHYFESSCDSAEKIVAPADVLKSDYFSELRIYNNQIFALDGFLNAATGIEYPKAYCEIDNVDYLIVKDAHGYNVYIRGANFDYKKISGVGITGSGNEIKISNQGAEITALKSNCIIED